LLALYRRLLQALTAFKTFMASNNMSSIGGVTDTALFTKGRKHFLECAASKLQTHLAFTRPSNHHSHHNCFRAHAPVLSPLVHLPVPLPPHLYLPGFSLLCPPHCFAHRQKAMLPGADGMGESYKEGAETEVATM
jgi:hypothetical protein